MDFFVTLYGFAVQLCSQDGIQGVISYSTTSFDWRALV